LRRPGPLGWGKALSGLLPGVRLRQVACSMADQALSVGGMLLVNLVLARTQSRQDYGMFALSCSVLTFLLGLHNAAILEPYTVFGSGRLQEHWAEYSRLMFASNRVVGGALMALVLGLYVMFHGMAPRFFPPVIAGLGAAVGLLFSGAMLRRTFYLQRQASLAAAGSLIFFVTVGAGLGLAIRSRVLNGFSAFLILAVGWLAARLGLGHRLPSQKNWKIFHAAEPGYWREHWKYARWVLLTAFVFQLTTQGYYWLVAGLLSVRDVAELKAMSLVVAPADQIFIALNYLVLPVFSAQYAAGRMAELLAGWKWYATGIVAATLAFYLVIRVVGGRLTHLLYGGRYDDAAPLLALLALLPAVMGIGHTMNAALKASESPQLVFWAYVASGLVTFVAGMPLVVRFGLRGAVYGMLGSGASYTAALAVGFAKTFRWGRRQLAAAAG